MMPALTAYAPGNRAFDLERIAEPCRRTLYKFVPHAWKLIDPAPYVDNWHIGAICEHLQAVTDKQIQKLIINMPPGAAKSSVVSAIWPAWEWISKPGEQTLFGSYDVNLALRDSVKSREIITDPWFREAFRPSWKLTKDSNAKGFYKNTMGGSRYTFGMQSGGKTGWRANKVILDDPNDVKARFDARIKLGIYDIFNSVISTRVNDVMTSAFILVQHRVATDDMTGKLLEEAENAEAAAYVNRSMPFQWVHLKLPMSATPSKRCFTFVNGKEFWKDPREKEGELLFPQKFPQEACDYYRMFKLGEDGYAGQFMQEPVPDGGSRFKKPFQHWFDRGRGAAALHRKNGLIEIVNLNLCWTFVTVDLAASTDQRADYTVFSTWAVTDKFDMLLTDVRRGHWEEPETIRNFEDIYSQTGYGEKRHLCFVVEDNGLGLPIVQAAQARGIPILPVHIHRTCKFVRSATAAIRLDAGQIFFPDPKTPWYCDPKEGWEIEITRFPAFAHDDQADTLSLAAEAVYQAHIGGVADGATVTRDIKDAVETMEGRHKTPAVQAMGKRFFGVR